MTTKVKRNIAYLLSFLIIAIVIFILSMRPDTVKMVDQTLSEKLNNGNTIYYVVVGDSIGRGAGAETKQESWHGQLENLVKQRYGARMKGQYIVQSGATAFEGLYKLRNTEMHYPADIIFLVFGENDRKYMESREFAQQYELLLREAKLRAPNAEIITFIESPLNVQSFAEEIQLVSDYYEAVSIDMRAVYAHSGIAVKHLNKDQIHPNRMGYELYAKAILEALEHYPDRHVPPLKESIYIQEDAPFHLTKSIVSQKGFMYTNGYWTADKKGSSIRYKANGNTIGAIIKRNPNGGMVDVFIDNQYYRTMNTNWPLVKERSIILATGLENKEHLIEFITIDHGQRFEGLAEKPFQLSGILSGTIIPKETME